MAGRTIAGAEFAASVRLRIPHLLGTVTLEPRDMAPCATLLVRRLADPLPRRLVSSIGALSVSQEWERSAQASLGDLRRRAARPAFGYVPAGTEAVFFADQAELMACLARDLLAGEGSKWWWRALLRALPVDPVRALAASWQREARYVPATLERLAGQGDAIRVVEALSPAQAWEVFAEVVRQFDLGRLLDPPIPNVTQETMRNRETHPPDQRPLTSVRRETGHAPVPWLGILSDRAVPRSLGMERCALLGTSLMIQRGASVVRSIEFAQKFAVWRISFVQSAPPIQKPSPKTWSLNHDEPGAAPEVREWAEEPDAPLLQSSSPLVTLRPSIQEGDAVKDVFRHETPLASDTAHIAAEETHFAFPISSDLDELPSSLEPAQYAGTDKAIPDPSHAVPSIRGTTQPPTTPELVAQREEANDPDSTWRVASPAEQSLLAGDHVETRIAGTLFLIQLVRTLRLPASLDEQCGRELGLGSWEWIELLSRCLLGPRHSNVASDPMWIALAMLAGRDPGLPPGTAFCPAKIYRIPDLWLSALTKSEAALQSTIRVRSSRFELWHPVGFKTLDCLGAPPHSDRIRPRSLRSHRQGCLPVGLNANRALQRCLAFVMPYVRWRLSAALGGADLATHVLLRQGKLWVTSTHVDAEMSLEQVSGRVRLAGLDTDPGWVPLLGRVVKFHFR